MTSLRMSLLWALLAGAPALAATPTVEVRDWQRTESAPGELTLSAQVSGEGFRAPALLLGGLVEPVEVAVDGAVVHPPGPALGAHGGWRWLLVPLPIGGKHTVTLRLRENAPSFLGAPQTAYVGEHGQVVVAAIADQLPSLILTLLFGAVGALSMLVFWRRREQHLFLSFGIYAIATALIFWARSSLHSILWDDSPAVWEHLRLAARAQALSQLVAFFALLGPSRHWRWVIAAWIAGAVGLALVGLDALTGGLLHGAVTGLLNLGLLGALIAAGILLFPCVRAEPRRYLASAVGVVLVTAAGLADAAGWERAPSLTLAAGLFLFCAMGDLVLRRFTGVFAALQEEVRARDEFLSVVAHELRNPLAAVKAGVDLLSAQVTRPDHQKHLEMVTRQLRYLARLMDDLVDLGRIRAGRLKIVPQALRVSSAASSAMETMRHVALARGVQLRAEVPEEPLGVEADPMRLEQMVTNLLRNAIQHTASGGSVTLAVEPTPTHVQLHVRDTGRGMSAELLKNLFESSDSQVFPRASRGDSDGMGVGLALVRKLATLQGGALTAHSPGLNQGSEFTLTLRRTSPPGERPSLPIRPEEPQASARVELEMPTPPQSGSPPALTEAAPARRILVIDDNANLRLSMRLLLEHSGFRVQEAGDGRTGLEQLLSGAFDAAVVDLRMPEVDGMEVARRVRSHPVGQKVRLVALTGFGREEDHQAARAAGFDDVLVKPANPDQLARALL